MKRIREFREKATADSGFTLVELIVVIAILGILAGVAYPVYTGYIKRANDAKVISKLSSVVVTVESARAIAGQTDAVKSISIGNDGTVTIDPAISDTTAETKYKNALEELNAEIFDDNGLRGTTEDEIKTLLETKNSSYDGFTSIVWTSTSQEWTKDPPSGEEDSTAP